MNLHLLYSAVCARYRILLFVMAATVLVATVVSLVMPKTYVATVAMLVDSKDEQSMSSTSPGHVRERTGYMQTQVDIITSQKVAQKVVNDLQLTEEPTWRRAFEKATDGEGSIEAWLATVLRKQLRVDISQSSVINIDFSWTNAEVAARVANAFAKAYMETALELRVEPSRQTAAWFDEQMQVLRTNLEQAQARLNSYQREKGIVALDERLDAENIALTNLANQIARIQARRNGTVLPELDGSPVTQGIRADLRRSEAKLQELSSRLGSNHPWYQRQFAETQNLRARLSAETGRSTGNSVQQNERRESELRRAMAEQQARIIELKQYRGQAAVLLRDVEIAQKSYEIALQRAVDKRVESHARLTNVGILNPAIAPFKAARPRIALNIGLAAVIGLLLGLSIIYLMEMFDRRVRSLGDLSNELQIPVLAELNVWQPPQRQLPGRQSMVPHLPNPG